MSILFLTFISIYLFIIFVLCRAPGYPTNGMGMTAFGNQASNAANALASHPILQQGYIFLFLSMYI